MKQGVTNSILPWNQSVCFKIYCIPIGVSLVEKSGSRVELSEVQESQIDINETPI